MNNISVFSELISSSVGCFNMELRFVRDPLLAAKQLRALELEKKRIALSRAK